MLTPIKKAFNIIIKKRELNAVWMSEFSFKIGEIYNKAFIWLYFIIKWYHNWPYLYTVFLIFKE